MQLRKRLLVVLIVTLFCTSAASAGPAETVEAGVVFGGQSTEANMSAASTMNLSDFPTIVEVYTATWCSNCVDVEHALDDVESNLSMQQYHTHRSISEVQDPFGTDELDSRYHERYGRWSPPAVVFNGTVMIKGSVAQSESLQQDFATIVNQPLQLGNGTSTFGWTPTGDSSGTVTWATNVDHNQFGEGSLEAHLWVVEASAYFEDGSNGLEHYPHIMREIIPLGNASQGSVDVQLPPAFDGDDLSVHLVYQFTPLVEEEIVEPEAPVADSESIPFVHSLATLTMIGAAAYARRW